MATDHSMCTGPATSCSNTVRWHVAATNRFVCTGEFLWKSLSPQQNLVAATSRKKSNQTEFAQLVAATKFCVETKIFTKFLQYTQSDLSPRCVAATCCCNLSPSVYRPLVIRIYAARSSNFDNHSDDSNNINNNNLCLYSLLLKTKVITTMKIFKVKIRVLVTWNKLGGSGARQPVYTGIKTITGQQEDWSTKYNALLIKGKERKKGEEEKCYFYTTKEV